MPHTAEIECTMFYSVRSPDLLSQGLIYIGYCAEAQRVQRLCLLQGTSTLVLVTRT